MGSEETVRTRFSSALAGEKEKKETNEVSQQLEKNVRKATILDRRKRPR